MEAKTGPFAGLQQNEQEGIPQEPEVEKWWTPRKVSEGYSLLYSLYIEPEGTGIEEMPVQKLWQSHPAFRCYEFEKFEEYNKKMIKLTNKNRQQVKQDMEDFEHDMQLMPERSFTLNGEPFWHNHPAKELLNKDIENGLSSSLKPAALRNTRPEYKEFSGKKFCKEVHHQKQRRRAKPFWVWDRNKRGREMHDKQVCEIRKEWINSNDEDVNDLINTLKNI